MVRRNTMIEKQPSPSEIRRQLARNRLLFQRGSRVENSYASALRGVARQVGSLVAGMFSERDVMKMRNVLERYAEILNPWAVSVAERTVREIAQRNASSWATLGKQLGVGLRREIEHAPTGEVTRRLVAQQVDLIKSIPKSAAARLEALTLKMLEGGLRSEEVAERVRQTGPISLRKANNIARDLAHAGSSAMTMARAEYVGAQGYVWRTALDSEVRKLHRKLEGKFIDFDAPPIAGEHGERAHAGMIWGCRCWMEPVLPEVIR